MQLHTYLNYGGNCEEAFRFYEQHMDGRITMLMRHGEQRDGRPVHPSGSSSACTATRSARIGR